MKHVIAWAQAFALSIGGLGLFFVAFLDASVLSLPEVNDILIVYMVTKSPSFLVYYAAMATAGSVGGSLIVYGGRNDDTVSPAQLQGWAGYCEAGGAFRVRGGGAERDERRYARAGRRGAGEAETPDDPDRRRAARR